MLILVVWAICGIAGAMIFQSKNRRAWHGAALGVVLGVFGVLIAACMSKKKPGEYTESPLSWNRDSVRQLDLSDRDPQR
jgi:hypothetical protein